MPLSPGELAGRGLRVLTSPLRLLPDFLTIGAQKAGTTSLYEYLLASPSVGAPSVKEVHFFDLKWERGPAWYRAQFPAVLEKKRAEAAGQPFITGEATPYYLYHPQVPERVRSLLPGVKLIVMLRNPVDRAFSHFQHESRAGRETLTFEQALERERVRLEADPARMSGAQDFSSARRRHSYLDRGHYAEQLERWLALFRREQFLILNSERFYADPAAGTSHAAAFLGIPAPQGLDYRPYNAGQYAGMDPATRERLLEYYRPHNDRLYRLLGEEYDWDR